MAPERIHSQRWSVAASPIQGIVRRFEDNPPINVLRASIAGLLALGSLAAGLQHSVDPSLAQSNQITIGCDGTNCGTTSPSTTLSNSVEHSTPEEPVSTVSNTVPAQSSAIESPTDSSQVAAQEIKPPEPPTRTKNEPMRDALEDVLSRIPTLEELAVLFPAQYGDWQKQLEQISYLDQAVNVTVGDFLAFRFDDSFVGVFDDLDGYKTIIRPELIVLHTTGHRYPPGQEGGALFATGLKMRSGGPYSCNYFVNHEGAAVYRYYQEDTHMTACAKGVNEKAINIEVEADITSPDAPASSMIYDITPMALVKTILTVVWLARGNNLAISDYTVAGHMAIAMIFNNETFNPIDKTVDSLGKFDVPTDLAKLIIRKASELDEQLQRVNWIDKAMTDSRTN